jgi:hypothetical protein
MEQRRRRSSVLAKQAQIGTYCDLAPCVVCKKRHETITVVRANDLSACPWKHNVGCSSNCDGQQHCT